MCVFVLRAVSLVDIIESHIDLFLKQQRCGTYTIKALKTLYYMYYPVNAFQVKLNLLVCGRERERERERERSSEKILLLLIPIKKPADK